MVRCKILALVALATTLAGCATPSGEAVAHWFSGSMGRLRDAIDPDKLVAPELRRGKRLLAKVPGYPTREVHRSRSLVGATVQEAGRVSLRTQQLPERLMAVAHRETTHTRRRAAGLFAPDGLLRRTLEPKAHIRAARRIYHKLPTALGLDRQILPGPGDPDRQTVAHPTPPKETWVEKVLRRVRL